MTFEEAKAYLKKVSLSGSVLGLERVKELLRLMGNPQNRVKIIHVAGTNGKGSFSAMMTAVLRRAGYKVGGFSSPAITDITDSYRINGTEITHEKFAELISRIAPLCDGMTEKPTEFEIMAAAAFGLFVREKCDIAVVECGMGGDTDATNVMDSPVLSVITNVQSDHCGFLGSTISEIASHKAGIIKKGCPSYFGGENPDALEVVSERAGEVGSEVSFADFSKVSDVCFSLDGLEFVYSGMKMRVPLLGTYQLKNVVNVLSCAEILRKNGFDIGIEDIAGGLAESKWHGRFEVLRRNPYVIFDGAHNPDGIKSASETLRLYFKNKKIALLIGVMADKEYGLYADMLGDLLEKVFTVVPDNPRALDSEMLAEVFRAKGIETESFEILAEGVQNAQKYAKYKNIPLVALGSLYMYKDFTAALEKTE